ncbi:MAG: D-lyxose/D-mannose family sugar isomerase [Rectinemataceae bacterium]|jgi:D-lyxose ketol-isomerase
MSMNEGEVRRAQGKAAAMLTRAGIAITRQEKDRIEICDYGLGRFEQIGTEIVIYVNTDRVCAKELVLFPWQLCPEHVHPQLGDYQGKEETFRCRWGEIYLYVPGEATASPRAKVPADKKAHLHVWHEILLKPGDQYTLREKTLHWFQAGSEGAIVSEFSTKSYDDKDIFSDPEIKRVSNLD